jgi:hypothetical protein
MGPSAGFSRRHPLWAWVACVSHTLDHLAVRALQPKHSSMTCSTAGCGCYESHHIAEHSVPSRMRCLTHHHSTTDKDTYCVRLSCACLLTLLVLWHNLSLGAGCAPFMDGVGQLQLSRELEYYILPVHICSAPLAHRCGRTSDPHYNNIAMLPQIPNRTSAFCTGPKEVQPPMCMKGAQRDAGTPDQRRAWTASSSAYATSSRST